MKKHVYEYKVQGSGYFPVDMLRYDQAWPACQDDASNLLTETRDLMEKGTYQVLLNGIKEPTVDRWRSFGWAVLKCPVWKRGKMEEAFCKRIS